MHAKTPPSSRPLAKLPGPELGAIFERAIAVRDGALGAHAIHESWLRGEISLNVERALELLWSRAAASIPEWLPTRYVDRLAEIYEIALRFRAEAKGRSHVYLVLLDYSDRRAEPFGLYVGMTGYRPAQRFDQHKAGIRAAGSVLKRGLELLAGPTMHLQYIARGDAVRIEAGFAEALRAEGFLVQGGH
ncbi:MAG TPA: hypothetical protein VMU86_03995 [Steroidobacteraceae bacterium]|nr:hypothetical protein [Steroidobacteraceae bacterium]